MSLIRRASRAPLTELAYLQREVEQLFGRFAQIERGEPTVPGKWSPQIDVYECQGSLVAVVEVPGLATESLRVTYRNHSLQISGERKERRPAGGAAAYLCVERPQGRFTRAIPLDVAVDIEKAEARLSGGLLTITVPRLKDRRGRESVIPIRREDT
jgi:HSP20 family protein